LPTKARFLYGLVTFKTLTTQRPADLRDLLHYQQGKFVPAADDCCRIPVYELSVAVGLSAMQRPMEGSHLVTHQLILSDQILYLLLIATLKLNFTEIVLGIHETVYHLQSAVQQLTFSILPAVQ
jgi:hypothetical protein